MFKSFNLALAAGIVLTVVFALVLGANLLFASPNAIENISSGNLPSLNADFSEKQLFSSGSVTGYSLEHHSQPTLMSLQGTVEDLNGQAVNGTLGVKVSDVSSCTDTVFFDVNFSNAIADGGFNLLLGENPILSLNYNQDYFMCLYVNGELLEGPQRFRGGQGQISSDDISEDLNISRDLNIGSNLFINDKVGIGTIFPNEKLRIKGSGNQDVAVILENIDALAAAGMRLEGTPDRFLIGTFGGVPLHFLTSAALRMTIDTQGRVGINTQTPHSSALLDLTSTFPSLGFLLPRMNSTQRNSISSPANGLQIYNTDANKIEFFNGSSWTSSGADNLGNHTAAQNLNLNGFNLINAFNAEIDNNLSVDGNAYIKGKLTVDGPIDPTYIVIGTASEENASLGDVIASGNVKIEGQIVAPNNPSARAYTNNDQTIPSDSWTTISFESENFDSAGMHDTSTNNSRITIPADSEGKYLIIASCRFSAIEAGKKGCRIQLNGTTVLAMASDTAMTLEELQAGDFIEMQAMQKSQSSQIIDKGREATYLSATKTG